MFRNPIIPWVLAVFGITMAILFSIRAERALQRAQVAERAIASRQSFESQSKDMEPATFVKLEGTTLTYRVPVQVNVGGELFADLEQRTAQVSDDTLVRGIVDASGLEALRRIQPGAALGIRTATEDGVLRIYSLVVVP